MQTMISREMKHLLSLLLAAMLLAPAAAGAKVPDEADILARTTDTESPYYYTSLMMRYNAGDRTLDDEDYHYLYYGYAYQEAYKPLESNPDFDKVLMLASGMDIDHPNLASVEALVSLCTKALERDPFSPRLLNVMAYAYGALGDTLREQAYYRKMQGVVRTIASSGDGLTQKTPRHILMFDHANDVLTVEGMVGTKGRVISRTVEFVPLLEPYAIEGKKRRGLYFDFSRIYRNKPEGYTYKRDRTWQFNNLKPRTYK